MLSEEVLLNQSRSVRVTTHRILVYEADGGNASILLEDIDGYKVRRLTFGRWLWYAAAWFVLGALALVSLRNVPDLGSVVLKLLIAWLAPPFVFVLGYFLTAKSVVQFWAGGFCAIAEMGSCSSAELTHCLFVLDSAKQHRLQGINVSLRSLASALHGSSPPRPFGEHGSVEPAAPPLAR